MKHRQRQGQIPKNKIKYGNCLNHLANIDLRAGKQEMAFRRPMKILNDWMREVF